jgi:hypothetical protein
MRMSCGELPLRTNKQVTNGALIPMQTVACSPSAVNVRFVSSNKICLRGASKEFRCPARLPQVLLAASARGSSAAPAAEGAWLSPKVATLMGELLDGARTVAAAAGQASRPLAALGGGVDGGATAAAGRRPWGAIVFVQERLTALALARLANSLPALRAAGLRAAAFLGHNKTGGAEDGLMSVAVRRAVGLHSLGSCSRDPSPAFVVVGGREV